jgi:chondroitin 4-sulfotransferase 11
MTDLHFKPDGDCIFIHIPKTAGISIYESVLDLKRPFDWFCGLDLIYLQSLIDRAKTKKDVSTLRDKMRQSRLHHWPKKGASILGHFHYLSLINAGKLDQDYFDKSFKFAFVRNPYDRLVSLYKYHRVQKLLGYSFDDFVEILSQEFQGGNVPPVGLYNIKPFAMTSPLFHIDIYGNQYNPMVDWLPDDKNVLICYLESFEDDIDKLLSMMGYEGKRDPVPRKNKSKYDDNYLDFYSNRKTIELVNQIYKQDFIRFGYEML